MSKPISMDKTSAPIPKPGRGGLKGYFSEVIRELKKVQWPTPRETTRLTGVVVAVCAICLVVIYALSLVISSVIDMVVRK